MTTDTQASNSQIEQFLTFQLAGEAYGVEILKVQEIRGWEAVRVIPNTPAFIKGALNLRGAIVPIIDLRERFSMEKSEYSPMTVVIVLCVEHDENSYVMGVVADAVSDVLDVKVADIKQAPNLGAKINTRYMRGIYVHKQSMIMLLDVDKLLNPDELESINSMVC
ncbi:MAG: chemotaxis protein CheW [Methylobacter sp.]|uniref:chemotaxis protein CheW n=1 Tax=Methylobacter sp. TaxID=2051955 RepID=UPI002590E854|nr:chemotaxis protein CheW [Methylobacter sp.]MCL7419556.1 chemotaxis protein CheW [Methylobacter sp.]